jgi:hypothetical protein
MGLVGGVEMKIDRLIEIERKEGTDVRNQTRSKGVRCLCTIAQVKVNGVVEAENDVTHSVEP